MSWNTVSNQPNEHAQRNIQDNTYCLHLRLEALKRELQWLVIQ